MSDPSKNDLVLCIISVFGDVVFAESPTKGTKMKNLLIAVLFALPLVLSGCSGTVDEVAPPTKAPELTPEQKQSMEDQVNKMREMHKK